MNDLFTLSRLPLREAEADVTVISHLLRRKIGSVISALLYVVSEGADFTVGFMRRNCLSTSEGIFMLKIEKLKTPNLISRLYVLNQPALG